MVTAIVVVTGRVLGGPSQALATLQTQLERSPRGRLGLVVSWVAVLAAVLVLALIDSGSSEAGNVVLVVLGCLLAALNVVALSVRNIQK
jgi:peptidoglycan/LPS O-acetylase OafA/YrhL